MVVQNVLMLSQIVDLLNTSHLCLDLTYTELKTENLIEFF